MTKYNWTTPPGQSEEQLAAGRFSAELGAVIPGMGNYSANARHDIALAEMLAGGIGSGRADLLDPRDFGTMSDDPTFDNEPAIQAAIDQAFTNHKAGYDGSYHADLDARSGVLLPQAGATGGWRINTPLWVKGGVGFVGSWVSGPVYDSTSRLLPSFGGGYAVVMTSALDRVASMIVQGSAGAGSYAYHVARAWSELGFDPFPSYPSPGNNYFDFRECYRGFDLHGLAQLCVEFTFKPDVNTIADGFFLSSMGRYKASEQAAAQAGGAFRIFPYSDGVVAQITTTNGTFRTSIVSPGTGIISGGTYHRIILDYDGAHLRVYIDTTLVDSVAVTGTIVQHDAEGVFFGRHLSQMPYISELAAQVSGYYGVMKFSKVSRYSGGTGASGEPAGIDANTIAIWDWGATKGPMVRASTNDGLAWLLRRGYPDPQSAAGMNDGFTYDLYGPVLRNVVVAASTSQNPLTNGYYIGASGGVRGVFESFHVTNGARVGIAFGHGGNGYGCTVRFSYNASWGGRYAFIGNHNLGLATPIEGMWLSGAKVLLAAYVSIAFRDCFFEGTGPGVPAAIDRDDGGSGSRYAVIFFGADVNNTLKLDSCYFSTEGGAYDLESLILLVHNGFGPTQLLMSGGGLEQFTSTLHALPGFGPTQPWVQFDTAVATQVYGANHAGGVSAIFDGVDFHFWGAARAVDNFLQVNGSGEFKPSVIRSPRFFAVPFKSLCSATGMVTLEMPNGVQQLTCLAGAAVAYSAEAHATSAANAGFLAWSIVLPAGSGGMLLIAVSYVATPGGAGIQGLLCGVAPFNVTTYPFATVVSLPAAPNYGDVVTQVWATQDVPAGTTVDLQVNFAGPVGVGAVITAQTVYLQRTQQGDPQEGYGVQFSQVTGLHTVHQDTYETLRPDCMVVDFVGGGPGAVPVADGGQTARAAVNATGIAYGSSTKPIATAARATAGWTLANTSVASTHVAVGVRPDCITFDALKGKAFYVLLTVNVALSHLVHLYDGMEITVVLKQDGVGGRTFAWPANVAGAPAPAAGANAVTIVKLYSDGAGGAYAK